MTYHPLYYASRDDKSDREQYLEWELEDARRREEEHREEAQRRYQQRMDARKERAYWDARTADTWPETLRQQASLFGNEAHLDDPEGVYGKPDTWFGDGAAACNRALEIWQELQKERQGEIDELERQIQTIRDSIRAETADRLETESAAGGWRSVAGALREIEEDPNELGRWLNW